MNNHIISLKVGVYGSASSDINEQAVLGARIVGEELAKRGHIVVTGAAPGIPYEAVQAAHLKGGKTIGYSPAVNKNISN
ncbi:MAG TPA: hypothetical protein VMR08_00990 [Patescibacteria group bacterium]|jgi:hypothetical protein|nr:hypothetical protein [Patescibacteria group bacterium]